MGAVNFACYIIGECAAIIRFLLDLNFILVHSLVRCILAFLSLVNNFPTLLTTSVQECWSLAVVYMVDLSGRCVHVLGGLLESIKMMGYLSSHVLLRTRELLHRGLLSAWDGCGIAVSLALYLANTAVNLLLIATQNLYAVMLSVWEAVASPLQKALELFVTLLTFLHSGLAGTSLILWTACRLALQLLGSLAHVFASVFLLNVYGALLTAITGVAVTLYLNPELLRRGASYADDYVNSAPALRRLRGALLRSYSGLREAHRRLPGALHRLYLLERGLWLQLNSAPALRRLWAALLHSYSGLREALRHLPGALHRLYLLERGLWRRLHWQGSQLSLRRWRAMIPSYRANRVGQGEQRRPPPDAMAPLRDDPYPGTTSDRPPLPYLLNNLKEQASRTCVICQDSNKTVVLLPCRHLCLCRDCTGILLRQPIYLQNCPLCRHMILKTIDVYL